MSNIINIKDRRKRNVIWEDKKRTIFGLPLSFTKYTLTDDLLYVSSGFLTRWEEEVRLYRIVDLSLSETLSQRMFNTGSILIESSDKSMPHLLLENIKNCADVKDKISALVEENRRDAGVINFNTI